MGRNVTRKQAERTLAAIRTQFAPFYEEVRAEDGRVIVAAQEGPTLVENWQWLDTPTPFAIVWEEGPYEWAMLAGHGGREEEFGATIKPVKLPAGVFTEPVTSWALGVYPA